MSRKDLRTEALTHRGWMKLLTIMLVDGSEVSTLASYMLLSTVDLKLENCTQPYDLHSPSMNVYITLWHSLGLSMKASILSHKKVIKTDGPTLLWILLKSNKV